MDNKTRDELIGLINTAQELGDLDGLKGASKELYTFLPERPLIEGHKNPNINRGGNEILSDYFKTPERISYLLTWVNFQPIIALLERESFCLPQERVSDDLFAHIHDLFETYLNALKGLPNQDIIGQEQIDACTVLCTAIQNALKNHFDGFPSKAFTELVAGLEKVMGYFSEFNSCFEKEGYSPLFYRMRVGNNHTYSRKEMFHIPFELRGLVGTQRYSIPGLPCLYLGSSAYICWEEMNRPDLNTVQTSLFLKRQGHELRYLDIGYTPGFIASHIRGFFRNFDPQCLTETTNSLRSYLVLWPLIAACSIRVKHKNHPFKPEYIIPQLLLQWIRISDTYDGVCYFSVAASCNHHNSIHLYRNYAFPVKKDKVQGHCDYLKGFFEVTDAVPWQMFLIFNSTGMGLDTIPSQHVAFEIIRGSKVSYATTDFARLECYLTQQEWGQIDG